MTIDGCLFQPTVIVPHAHWEAYGRAVSHCITWLQTQLILTTCQLRYGGGLTLFIMWCQLRCREHHMMNRVNPPPPSTMSVYKFTQRAVASPDAPQKPLVRKRARSWGAEWARPVLPG